MKTVSGCALILVAALATNACGDDTYGGYAYGGESPGAGPYEESKPSGEAECSERYFANRSAECASIDCGEAMVCTSDLECLTCVDRCEPTWCGSDQECEDTYGDLCTGVEWRCEPYITADQLRCAVHAAGSSQCGDGVCDADESCSGCSADCGYCPGSAPQMAPCTSDGDCASGWCDDWCVGACSSGYDCIGDGNGTLNGINGSCITITQGSSYCFPSCSVSDCSEYPGTSCVVTTTVEGWDDQVCSS